MHIRNEYLYQKRTYKQIVRPEISEAPRALLHTITRVNFLMSHEIIPALESPIATATHKLVMLVVVFLAMPLERKGACEGHITDVAYVRGSSRHADHGVQSASSFSVVETSRKN